MDRLIELVVANCEPRLSEWLALEYEHSVRLWREDDLGPVTFTGVTDGRMRERLAKHADVTSADVGRHVAGRPAIILDPTADSVLSPPDFDSHDAIVVGGILGTETFDGRTGRLVSAKVDGTLRHLGPIQLPIDIAVFAAKYVLLGGALTELEFTTELEIAHDDDTTTLLPYGYPVVDGRVIVTPGLVEYLRAGGTRGQG